MNKFTSITSSPRFDDDEEEKKQKKEEPFADKFLKTRQIILTGEINKDLADSIARQLLILDSESNEPIYMYIDSPGGDVDAGFAIYDVIRFVKSPVYLIGMGLIASAATLILLSVPKEQRVGLPNSRYLIHQPLGGMRGVATDIEIYAKDMEKFISKTTVSPRFDDDEEEKKQKPEAPFADRFLKTRQIILTGEINKDLADSIARQLLILDSESNDPIYMYIDSPGGDVDAGFAIYDVIRFVKSPVYLVGMGLIASAATLVLLSVPKEQRVGLPNSRYLIHQPLGGMRGVATDIEIYAKDMEKIRAKLNKIISDATGVSLEQVTKDTDRDYWLDSDEAVKYGLISKIITKREELK